MELHQERSPTPGFIGQLETHQHSPGLMENAKHPSQCAFTKLDEKMELSLPDNSTTPYNPNNCSDILGCSNLATDIGFRLQATDPAIEELTIPSPFNPLTSTLCRDILLSYAQNDYLKLAQPGSSRAIPVPLCRSNSGYLLSRIGNLRALLTSLRTYHSTHLPTLLLLGSMHFISGDFRSSLEVNQEILRFEPGYVEAMCNIGCVMRVFNELEAAYAWWWKALQLQPMYWDVMDNLFDLVSVDGQLTKGSPICDFIQSNLIDSNGRPRQPIPRDQVYRLQRVAYTRAFMIQAGCGNATQQPPDNYSHVVNLALLTPHFVGAEQLSLRDLIVATCITGLFFMDMVPHKILGMLGLESTTQVYEPHLDILHAVHVLGNDLIVALHEMGFDSLPVILLDPDQVKQLPVILFRTSNYVLPSNCSMDSVGNLTLLPETIRNSTDQITSQALLMIAKYFQDALDGTSLVDGTFQSCRISASLAMILYYLALALCPSAIACNNLGALMANNMSASLTNRKGQKMVDIETIKMAFYQYGLQLAPDHPHLLTNLGSALKEKGNIPIAISLYTRAVEIDPHLDSALVNLASTFRDVGRPWDSVTFYKQVRQQSPDVVCGLASALSAICDWRDRGWLKSESRMLQTLRSSPSHGGDDSGWIHQLISTCDMQIQSAYAQNIGLMRKTNSLQEWLRYVAFVYNDQPLSQAQWRKWERCISLFFTDFDRLEQCVNEGGFLIRLVDWLLRGLQRRWYNDEYGRLVQSENKKFRRVIGQNQRYLRPLMPNVGHFPVPSLQPFHTFSFHMDPRMIRLISHRNAVRVSYKAHTQAWLPRHVYPPPRPPHNGRLNVGYVSYDFIDHPLAHLVQSVFGFHDPSRFNIHAYATSPDDGSSYRRKIANDSHVFVDVSSWSLEAILNRIMADEIHILINLGGFTRGANNEIFAARPCPVQILMMGFPGSCGAGWCDYLLGDVIACPPNMRGEFVPREDGQSLDIGAEPDPESSEDWIFTEKMIYMPNTFMVTDHLQSFGRTPQLSFEEEETERNRKRIAIFPGIAPQTFIFANFNQLYKIDPVIFWVWLSILRRVPQSILWLLRFPGAGEEHLKRTAAAWAGDDVASRILFTDVASKEEHVRRGTVADLFLDTVECNAHTVAADVLWSGTPILTWPKHLHKMCSRVAASMAYATGFGDQMVVQSINDYEERAVTLALQTQAMPGRATNGTESELRALRRSLHRDRYSMPLFNAKLWTRNFEKACWEAWDRWVKGVDILNSTTCKRYISFTKDGEIEK